MWPIADNKFLIDDTVTVVVQVNGKLRGTIYVKLGADQSLVEEAAMSLETVSNALAGKAVKKVIYVKDKIINFIC
jgi:leucyl-tRNA synthetase